MKRICYKNLIEKNFLGEISKEEQDILCKWLLENKNNIREYIEETVILNILNEVFSYKPDLINILYSKID